MNSVIESNLIDWDAFINDDFDAYFKARVMALLDAIEFALGKSISDRGTLIFSVLKTSMMHPYTIDVDTIRCGPRGDPTFRWRPRGCPRFLTCPARAAASRDRRMT